MALSKSKVDKLGDRLRSGSFSEDDLRLLDDYRRSFDAAYEKVIGIIREQLRRAPTGRPAKSTTSVVDKLRRESIRLTQVQDIAGCRLVISDTYAQDVVVERLREQFATSQVVDRRDKPSHGYRAVHVIVDCEDRWVEIQVRTSLQHLWAELSEKCSDVFDPAIKYGGGDRDIHRMLMEISHLVARVEAIEANEREVSAKVEAMPRGKKLPPELQTLLPEVREELLQVKDSLANELRAFTLKVVTLKGSGNAVPD